MGKNLCFLLSIFLLLYFSGCNNNTVNSGQNYYNTPKIIGVSYPECVTGDTIQITLNFIYENNDIYFVLGDFPVSPIGKVDSVNYLVIVPEKLECDSIWCVASLIISEKYPLNITKIFDFNNVKEVQYQLGFQEPIAISNGTIESNTFYIRTINREVEFIQYNGLKLTFSLGGFLKKVEGYTKTRIEKGIDVKDYWAVNAFNDIYIKPKFIQNNFEYSLNKPKIGKDSVLVHDYLTASDSTYIQYSDSIYLKIIDN